MSRVKEVENGKIPDGWEWRELGSLGLVITGKTPSTRNADSFGKGYPFITPRDMVGQKYIRTTERHITEKGKNTVKNCLLPADSVCVSCIGSDMGKVVMTDRPCITNQQLNSLVCEQTEPHFVYYGIINIASKLRDAAFHSTAVPILNKSAFSRFEIPLPREKSKQRAIAKILSDLDDKIELNQRINKTIESIAQAIFKRWFVDETENSQISKLGDVLESIESGSRPKGGSCLTAIGIGFAGDSLAGIINKIGKL
jgi:type I restriction enzyme S subunit